MPLVVVCGFPSSGKTTATASLTTHLTEQNKRVVRVSDDDFNIDCNAVYADSKREKELRSNLKSAVQKHLQTDTVVIVDSLNYIKGYRYELFCIAKGARTTYCVLYACSNALVAKDYNANRNTSERYADDLFHALVDRFEEPCGNNRWDSPLFLASADTALDCGSVYDALFTSKVLKPNHSTESQPLASGNYLQDFDKGLQLVISSIMSGQKSAVPGDDLTVPGTDERLRLRKVFTISELGRLKRQFMTFSKTRGLDKSCNAVTLFVQYLNNQG